MVPKFKELRMKRARRFDQIDSFSPDGSSPDEGSSRRNNDPNSDQVLLGGSYAQAVRFIFIPHKVNREEPKLEAIRRLCSVGTSFEELILSWVQPAGLDSPVTSPPEPAIPSEQPQAGNQVCGSETEPGQTLDYCITISRNDEMPFRSIGVIFERGELCFGLACVPVDQVVALYGLHERLNESTFSLSDSEGFTCDQEWFEKRNVRLGIEEDAARACHLVPASSVGELVLEYALSTAGFARFAPAARPITAEGKSGTVARDEIEITLVFLGKDLTRGWHEEMCIGSSELEQHVKRTRSADTPTLLI